MGFPGSSAGKESACNAGDSSSISVLGRSAVEGIGYPLQYSGLENSMDCIVHGVTESDTSEQLSVSYDLLTLLLNSNTAGFRENQTIMGSTCGKPRFFSAPVPTLVSFPLWGWMRAHFRPRGHSTQSCSTTIRSQEGELLQLKELREPDIRPSIATLISSKQAIHLCWDDLVALQNPTLVPTLHENSHYLLPSF